MLCYTTETAMMFSAYILPILYSGLFGPVPVHAQFVVPLQTATEIQYVEHGSREKPQIALTFDADMTERMATALKSGKIKSLYDSQIIEILIKEKVPATIFLTGMWAEMYPDVSRKLAENDLFEIGNHSYDHSAFTTSCFHLKSTNDKEGQITKSQEAIKTATGITPTLFRFPGGCFEQQDLDAVAKQKLTTVGWDIVSGDASTKDPKVIIDHVIEKAENGSIIVMHLSGGPNAPATAEALKIIIPALRKKGFSFVKVSEFLDHSR